MKQQANKFIDLKIGTQFSYYEAEFEIEHIGLGKVTYAAVRGGQRRKMGILDFEERIKRESILIKDSDEFMSLRENERKSTFRRIKYCEFAVRNSNNPTSRSELKCLIPIVSKQLADLSPPHEKTLSYWVKDYLRAGTSGLISRPQRGNFSLRLDPAIEALIAEGIQKHYLVREHRNVNDVYSFVIGELLTKGDLLDKDKPPVSKRTIHRRIADLDQIAIIELRQGKEAAKRASRASGKKIVSHGALVKTEIDTFYANVVIIDPETGACLGRPFVICIICVYTKIIVGYHITLYSTNNTTTLAAIINAVTTYGTPTMIVGDRGKEFVNSSLEALCNEMLIGLKVPPARTPNAKPHIESFFRTLSYDFTNKLVGTTKSSPEELGDYDSKKFAIMTMQEFQEYFVRWKDEIYHKELHSGSGRVPIVHWEEECGKQTPMTVTMDYALKVARRPQMITVNKGTVRFDDLTYYSHALTKYNGQKLKVLINDLDLSLVYVEDPENKGTLIEGKSNDEEYTSELTYDQHMAARKLKKEIGKEDLKIVGKFASVYSRYLLLSDLQKNKNIGIRARARLLQGKSTKTMEEKFAARNDLNAAFSDPETQCNTDEQNHGAIASTEATDSLDPEIPFGEAQATNTSKKFNQLTTIMMEKKNDYKLP